MTIEEIFSSYTDRVAEVQQFRWLTEGAANEEYQALLKRAESARSSATEAQMVSIQAVRFRSASTGQKLLYGFHQLTIEDRLAALVRHTNRQHQWFLVEAYELFEEFLKRAYALMGATDPTRWTSKDLDKLSPENAAAMGFDWFLSRARAKADLPQSILRQFGLAYPQLKVVESRNRLDVDLVVAANLLAQMRHHIVHTRGVVADRQKFVDKVLRKVGLCGAGLEKPSEFINSQLLLDDDGVIYLLKVRDREAPEPLRVHYDVFDGLTNYLLAYAREISVALGYVAPTPNAPVAA